MVSFFNSCNRLRPTETHQKKLLLYTIESLVTYDALLQQLQQTDGIFDTVSGFSNCNRLFRHHGIFIQQSCFNSCNRLKSSETYKKKLFLSAMASSVPYGALLQQLQQIDGIFSH
ncbi:hypothetical protein CDAR_512811 [Caerostris darwini]|uniref:Uncharacterized protein n=1 Tax=Caerostris darwini TaxID=1538125 RepID=A0AAV4SDE3_9ARAC|nr:hypothetical protein CDAR_512811 [Caerostris darwini]